MDPKAPAAEQLVELAEALVEQLGGDWRRVEVGRERWDGRRQFVARVDGAEWSIGRHWRQAERLDVVGFFPKSEVDGSAFHARDVRYGGQYRSITVARTRTAAEIAGDIRRRFLPGYLAELEHVRTERDGYDADLRWEKSTAEDLAAILGTSVYEVSWNRERSRFDGPVDRCLGPRWSLRGQVRGMYRRDAGSEVELVIQCNAEVARAVLAELRRQPLQESREAAGAVDTEEPGE